MHPAGPDRTCSADGATLDRDIVVDDDDATPMPSAWTSSVAISKFIV
jgi:hypothetical protein